MPRHLVLVGLPGCGKSTVGQQVADGLGAPLFDIDSLLVREMGMPVEQIFGMVGEQRFREIEQKAVLAKLSPSQVTATELAGEPITATLTEAPGNGAALGGLKVTTENGWFAARPSGTEDVYKIYAESFSGPDHLARIQEEARAIVGAALG